MLRPVHHARFSEYWQRWFPACNQSEDLSPKIAFSTALMHVTCEKCKQRADAAVIEFLGNDVKKVK